MGDDNDCKTRLNDVYIDSGEFFFVCVCRWLQALKQNSPHKKKMKM